jgi:hypothetical protein
MRHLDAERDGSTMTKFALILLTAALTVLFTTELSAQRSSGMGMNNPFTPSPSTALSPKVEPTLSSNAASADAQPTLTGKYRIGANDVIRIENSEDGSSLYVTALAQGNLLPEYQNRQFRLAGKTTDEVAAELSRTFGISGVQVSVREYASHFVLVKTTGQTPFRLTMRREAIPLFLVRTEAGIGGEYRSARIVRPGQSQTFVVDLSTAESLNLLILPGDEIEFVPADTRY